MQYLITFLEGMITFISPCLLPMLPIYIIYFAGGGERSTRKTLTNAAGFVAGFTVLFVILGVSAAAAGKFLIEHKLAVNIVSGFIVILFGLNFCGLLKLGFLSRTHRAESAVRPAGFFSSFIFGIIFSVGWTPCVGAFLGSALALALQGSLLEGGLLLLVYSLGLGIPFIVSAILIEKLKGAFDFIKRNYHTINIICGILLIITGILIMTGVAGKVMSLAS